MLYFALHYESVCDICVNCEEFILMILLRLSFVILIFDPIVYFAYLTLAIYFSEFLVSSSCVYVSVFVLFLFFLLSFSVVEHHNYNLRKQGNKENLPSNFCYEHGILCIISIM